MKKTSNITANDVKNGVNLTPEKRQFKKYFYIEWFEYMNKFLILVNVPTPSPVLDHVSYCATNHVSQAASKDGRNVCYNKKNITHPGSNGPLAYLPTGIE